MKKMFLALLCAMPLFYACKSASVDLAEYSPVALITVYGNPSVPWYTESSNSESVEDGVITGAVNRVINKTNPETTTAQERIDEASALLSEKMRTFGLKVIDPSTDNTLPAYKNAGKNFLDYLGNTVPAAGYDAITSTNGKLNRTMCKESGAVSTLYVNFRFQKVLVKEGVRNKGVAARLVMSVFGTNAAGKRILNHEYKAVSTDYADLIKSSDWDKEKVLSFYPELENRVINEFLADYMLSSIEAPEDAKPTTIKLKPKPATEAASEKITEDAVLAEKRNTAKKLLERGMSAQETAEITGLTVEQVEALMNESAE